MSGKEIFETVYFDIMSDRDQTRATIDSPSIRDVVDSMNVFQKEALYDIVGAIVEPETFWSENKRRSLKTAIGTMNDEQKIVLYVCAGYAEAMFAH